MKFTGSILALLAGSAAGFAPLGGPSTASTPSSGVRKNQPTALNGIFEVVIGTGSQDRGGTDAPVKLTLFDKSGESYQTEIKGEGNYERGSITVKSSIEYPEIEEPAEFQFDVSGGWCYGGVWVTNLKTGTCYFNVAPGTGTMIGSKLRTDLEEICGGEHNKDLYDIYKLTVSTLDDGTDDKVFCKVIDVGGNANTIQQPGEEGNLLNPMKTWKPYTSQSASINTSSGVDLQMTNAKYLLLAKLGTDEWNPTRVNVQGLHGGMYGRDGEVIPFFPGWTLNKDNKKWRWMER